MVHDSDPIRVGSREPDSMVGMFTDMITNIQWRHYMLLFIVLIFSSTDVFINRIMSKFPAAVDGRCLSSYGTLIQVFIVIMVMIVVDMFISQGVV